MSRILAFIRAAWLTAVSYRTGIVFSLLALGATFVPVYFVSQALQPVVAESINTEGGDYFAFLLLGLIVMAFVIASVGTFPSRLSSTIATGTFEAVMATPTSLPEFVLGQVGYDIIWSGLRSTLMLGAGLLLGIHVAWSGAPLALLVVGLIIFCYLAVGVFAGAAVLVFRTSGPIVPGVVTATALLGGVYYSTSVIPSWIQNVSTIIPLTYGLRAVRRLLLEGASFAAVRYDIAVLFAFTAGLLVVAAATFAWALRYAKRAGTLSHY